MKCKAYQASDQMVCQCGNRWDVNDSHPPVCGSMAIQALRSHQNCGMLEAKETCSNYMLRKQLEAAGGLDEIKEIIGRLIPKISDSARVFLDDLLIRRE